MKPNKGQIIAIIRGVQSDNILEIVQTLRAEGIDWVEISLSEEETGLECLRVLVKEYGEDFQLGAGTVLNPGQVDKALAAGAKYIITPGWERDLVCYVKQKGVEIFPGVFSPGEILQARNEGIEVVKLFPAGNLGPEYIRNLFGPFPHLQLMAVGGINRNNIRAYYEAGCSSFAIGSDLVPRGAGKDQLDYIRTSAREYKQLMIL